MTLESELVKTMLYLERYHGDSLELIQDNLLTAQKNILNYIANETNQAKIKKYINEQISEAFDGVDEEVMKDVEHIQGTTWDAMGATMAKGFVVADLADSFVNYKSVSDGVKTRLNNEARLVQGHTLKDHFKHLSTTNARKLDGFIVDGNAKGLGTQEISRNIRNAIGNVNRNQVSTLVRTTLLEAIEEAKNESIEFFDDVIIGWKYSAVMDSRTSKICFINNNVRHKKKSDFKVLPKNHYQCRSMLVPITELSEELDKENDKRVVQWDGKTVNHRDGTTSTKFKVGEVKQVARNANAETYFKAFDKEYQIKYMGVKRYNLWKEGKMSFDEAFNASRKSGLKIDAVKNEVLKPKKLIYEIDESKYSFTEESKKSIEAEIQSLSKYPNIANGKIPIPKIHADMIGSDDSLASIMPSYKAEARNKRGYTIKEGSIFVKQNYAERSLEAINRHKDRIPKLEKRVADRKKQYIDSGKEEWAKDELDRAEKRLKNAKDVWTENENIGKHTAFTHEFGHELHLGSFDFLEDKTDMFNNLMKKHKSFDGLIANDLKNGYSISEYGRENIKEYMAESFTRYHHGLPINEDAKKFFDYVLGVKE